jgi:hypothetical protein
MEQSFKRESDASFLRVPDKVLKIIYTKNCGTVFLKTGGETP